MGIELPSELSGVAAAAGVQWPQADEDAMRASATAWRQAGQSLTAVSTDADGSASKALAGVQGDTATSARQHWNGFIEPDSGKLTTTAQGCNSAADQLEHAADQVGEAKVQIVRHLVTLAKNSDAAQQATAAGNPNAGLGLDTAVRGTAANVAQVNANLTNSIRLDGGASVYGQSSPVNANPGGGTFAGGAKGSGLGSLEPLLGKAGPLPQTVHGAGGVAGDVANLGTGPLATVTGHGGPGSASGAGLQGSAAGPGLPGVPVGGHGGPGLVTNVGGGQYTAPAGENTGPIQLPPMAQHGGAPGIGALGTGPEAHTPPLGVVQQSAYVGPSVSPTMHPFAGAAPAAPIGPVADPGAGQAPVGFAPMGPDAAMPVAPVQGGYGAQAPSWGSQYGAGPAAGGLAGGMVAGSAAPAQYATASGGGPGGALLDQPGAVASRSAVRRSTGPRDPEVAIFLVHMFPIGHLPVASSRPARQLPLPPSETDLAAGSRFEPHDHPDSAIFDTVTRPGDITGRTEGSPAPEELTANYDPLGGGNEADWDRRFLVRPATEDEAAEYAWPPGQSFPEGGCDHGEAVRLSPGTILDRFGTNEGRVFSAPGTSFAARSLPPAGLAAGYHRYEVLRDLPMWWALSTAWFGQPGGGVRYRAVYPAADLVASGFLKEISVGDEE
ncbi:MAG TPA: TNT domain-containing protein [Pseudonocardiaceae bacterium]